MNKLTEMGFYVLEKLAGDAGREESEAVGALLATVTDKDLAFEIDRAIGAYLCAVKEAAFLAGLEVGKDPLALLVER